MLIPQTPVQVDWTETEGSRTRTVDPCTPGASGEAVVITNACRGPPDSNQGGLDGDDGVDRR